MLNCLHARSAVQAADPAVDAVLRTCGEMKEKLPDLWQKRFVPIAQL